MEKSVGRGISVVNSHDSCQVTGSNQLPAEQCIQGSYCHSPLLHYCTLALHHSLHFSLWLPYQICLINIVNPYRMHYPAGKWRISIWQPAFTASISQKFWTLPPMRTSLERGLNPLRLQYEGNIVWRACSWNCRPTKTGGARLESVLVRRTTIDSHQRSNPEV